MSRNGPWPNFHVANLIRNCILLLYNVHDIIFLSLTRFFEYNFRAILFCQLHDLKHKVNYKIFYVYRADIVNFEKISSMSIILSYRCNVGVSLVVPLVVFNSTSYTRDLRFYLVQTNESLTNPRIWHMTAISCQIINLKVASI